jgi:hypothetical protein
LAPNSAKNGTPFELMTLQYGRACAVGTLTNVTAPVPGTSHPIMLAPAP